MKRFLILIVLVLAGCGESEKAVQETEEAVQETEDVFVQLEDSFSITEDEGELLNNLKLITDEQADIILALYKTKLVLWDANFVPLGLPLNGLNSITNHQAETLGKVRYNPPKELWLCTLYLNGLTSINH